MENTKKVIIPTLLILLATLLLAVIPTERDAAIYDDTVRLHILANSDSEDDQALKYEIRNLVLEKYSASLSSFDSIESAKAELTELLPDIKRDVDCWIDECGYSYDSEILLGCEWYDTREYEEFTLPCGYYTSLRIMLGNGDGKNWWCVMFPPKCLDMATESAPKDDGVIDYTKEETALITGGGYSVKFKILELISETLAELSKSR